MGIIDRPTIIVWAMALFSSSIRWQAKGTGQWVAGWFQALLFYLPFVGGMIGQAF